MSEKYQCSLERFLKDIQDHEMNIIRDEGLYRHIRYKRPGSMSYYYDLITWKGHLCITGDMGTYVFSRIEDMFEFFVDEEDLGNNKLTINPYYWQQKVLSESRFGDGVEEFSSELFEENIKRHFELYFEDEGDEDIKKETWEAIKNEILYYTDDHSYFLYDRVFNFEYKGFQFDDFWETNNKVYTFHYIWICYAIVWGIKKYFKEKKNKRSLQLDKVNA